MITRDAQAHWTGDLKQGEGNLETGSGSLKGKYSANTRFGDEKGTNPEEMLGAAHAGCYSMSLAKLLASAGHKAESIDTKANVALEKDGDSFRISRITLNTEASVQGVSEDDFMKMANSARDECLVSKVLGDIDINLNAKLKS